MPILQAIAVYSWVGIIVFAVLGLNEIDKARRAKTKAPVSGPAVLKSAVTWVHCPNGHCKVLADHDWSCPVCGAQLVSPQALLIDPSSGRFVAVLPEAA
jgi:hypothetical protein